MSRDDALARAQRLLNSGRLNEAEEQLRDILAGRPDDPGALHALGLVHLQRDETERACELLTSALDLAPESVVYRVNAALAMQHDGRMDDAEVAYRRAIRQTPQFAPAHYNLGLLLRQQQRFDEAEAAFRRAIELRPDDIDGRGNLASILARRGKLREAEAIYREALERAPEDARLYCGLAGVLEDLGAIDAARAAYLRALELRPRFGEAALNLSLLLHRAGHRAEAEDAARRAVALLPGDVEALCHLAACHTFRPGDPEIDKLAAALRDDLSKDRRRHLLAALGKANDDMGRYDVAFDHFRQANELAGRAPHRNERLSAKIARIRAVFHEPLQRVVERGDECVAIFVVGLSRAGKTLVESLLAAHGDVYAAGERDDWTAAVNEMTRSRGTRAEFPEYVPGLSLREREELGRRYLDSMSSSAPDRRYLVNTMPGTLFHVGLVLACLPRVKVIHCHREAADQCLFMFFHQYRRGHYYTNDLRALADAYAAYLELREHWARLHGDEILDVAYEELVSAPQAAARRIYDYCGLRLEKDRLRTDLHAGEIGHWRCYEPQLAPLLRRLGATSSD